MREYATLVTDDISSAWSYPTFSHRETPKEYPAGSGSVIQALMKDGWECIDATTLPKLSLTGEEKPRFAFILARDLPSTSDGDSGA